MTGQVRQPWSMQVEPVEGCNRACHFCGINSIREKPGAYKYMSAETAEAAARGAAALCPGARCEFAMHGEPLMHPAAAERLAIFRQWLPAAQIQVTTNGKVLAGKMQERAEALFRAGVDFLLLDTYRPERDALQAEARCLTGIKVLDFYEDLAPKGESPYHNHGRKWARRIVLMDDIGQRDGEVGSRRLVNQAGHSPTGVKLAAPLARMCTLPFREITVAWNGNVNLCCEDWAGEYVCGNVNEQPLAEIWWGARMEAARKVLFQRRRSFSPCAVCDKGTGARVGLVPKYERPEAEDIATIRRVLAAGTGTTGRPIYIGGDLQEYE